MTLRYLLSTAEYKDLHIQFGVVVLTFINVVQLGIRALIHALFQHKKARVFWDRPLENLHSAARRTSLFLDIPGVVAIAIYENP